METLEQRYRRLCRQPSDINEHLPALYDLAKQSRTVVEFGVRYVVDLGAARTLQSGVLIAMD